MLINTDEWISPGEVVEILGYKKSINGKLLKNVRRVRFGKAFYVYNKSDALIERERLLKIMKQRLKRLEKSVKENYFKFNKPEKEGNANTNE